MKRHNRISRARFLAGALPLLALLLTGSCKWGVPDYSLTVTIGDGVTGTPEAGKHIYKELTTVTLNYTPVNSLNTVEVFLNGTIRQTGTGSFVMYGDAYTLLARLVDVRGTYSVSLTYSDPSVTSPAPFFITLTGPDLLSGNFTDERGYHGTWSGNANTLTLAYWDWQFYVLTTTVFNMGYSTGSFSGGGQTGTWVAQKQ
jgi:hypothetical protein